MDHDVAARFPTHGQPAASPWRLALICVFQCIEGMSDRQTADAVRSRDDWKYALGLVVTNAGFDFAVLFEFRTRLRRGSAEQHMLDILLTQFKTRGWRTARGKQRMDSTHILAAAEFAEIRLVHQYVREKAQVLSGLSFFYPRYLADCSSRPFKQHPTGGRGATTPTCTWPAVSDVCMNPLLIHNAHAAHINTRNAANIGCTPNDC